MIPFILCLLLWIENLILSRIQLFLIFICAKQLTKNNNRWHLDLIIFDEFENILVWYYVYFSVCSQSIELIVGTDSGISTLAQFESNSCISLTKHRVKYIQNNNLKALQTHLCKTSVKMLLYYVNRGQKRNEYLSVVFGSCCSHIYYYNIFTCQDYNSRHVWLVCVLMFITKN